MKKSKILVALSLSFLLVGCGAKTSDRPFASEESTIDSISSNIESADSSSSQSSEDDGIVTFSAAYDEIAALQKAELNNASSTSYRYENSTSRLSHVTEQTYTNYIDGSTSSVGTYKYINNEKNEVEAEDTFNTVATTEIDTYEIDGIQTSYNMFVQVTDYAKNKGKTYEFQDSASKLFIINSESEAGNLEDGDYILASDFAANASCNLTAKTANFLANNLMSSYYVTAKGFTVTPQSDGSLLYSVTNSYSYTEDGVITENTVSMKYTMDSNKEKLLTCELSNRVDYTTENNPEDTTYSLIKYSGSLTYGDKTAFEVGGNVIDPEKYFLTTVVTAKLKAMDANWNIIDVDTSAISETCSKLYGFADSFSPTKAMDTQLIPVSSSNEEAVKYDESEGVFKIVAAGTTNLTFSYYKKTNGVYKESKVLIKDVTIVVASAESITWGATYYTNQQYSLEVGESYTWNYSVKPSKAPQNITATSSDPDVLEVEVELGKITITAKKEGEATVTLTSIDVPSVSSTKSFYVFDDSDHASILTDNSFFCSYIGSVRVSDTYYSVANFEITVTFAKDGTGKADMVVYENSTKANILGTDSCDFTWTLSKTKLTFKNFALGSWSVSEGMLVKMVDEEGKPFGISVEESKTVVDRVLKVVSK